MEAQSYEQMFAADPRIRELPTERLEAEIATLYSRISAETCRWLEAGCGARPPGGLPEVGLSLVCGLALLALRGGPARRARAGARRVSCDASAVGIVERSGEPLAVGRKTRTIPPALRRALRARDGGCRSPGCSARRFVDAHHIQHWAHGGKTELGNLVSVCRHHHRLLHEGGFRVIGHPDGRITFVRPDGRELPTAPRLPTTSPTRRRPVVPAARRRGIDPLASCSATEHNDRLDLHLTVWCLLQPARRARLAARSP